MADTIVQNQCYPGVTAVTLTSNGGTGTPAPSYTPSPVVGDVYEITVPESLVGAFLAHDGIGATTPIQLEDINATIRIGQNDSELAIEPDSIDSIAQSVVDKLPAVGIFDADDAAMMLADAKEDEQ